MDGIQIPIVPGIMPIQNLTQLKRFATGTYVVWYPIIPRPDAHALAI